MTTYPDYKRLYKLNTAFLTEILEVSKDLEAFFDTPIYAIEDPNLPHNKNPDNLLSLRALNIFTYYFALFPITLGYIKVFSKQDKDAFRFSPEQEDIAKEISKHYFRIREIIKTRYATGVDNRAKDLNITYPISQENFDKFYKVSRDFFGNENLPMQGDLSLFNDFFTSFEDLLAAFVYQLNDTKRSRMYAQELALAEFYYYLYTPMAHALFYLTLWGPNAYGWLLLSKTIKIINSPVVLEDLEVI